MRRFRKQYKSLDPETFDIRYTFTMDGPRNRLNFLPEEIIEWCCDMFGDDARERWDFSLDTMFFLDQDDAFAFKMRWG